MPSSLIFAGLVVIWLLILVPAVARRRQEVARPSVAALSGRVLQRPPHKASAERTPMTRQRRRTQEVHVVYEAEQARPVSPEEDVELDDDDGGATTDDHWERPRARYRPGRGGFDPEAAALAARARYAFRQRVVLALLVAAAVTAIIALAVVPGLWWPHVLVDLALVGYLVYLRRQVRMEEAIRERRAARMAGTRRPAAAEDPELDEWARRGREVVQRSPAGDEEPAQEEATVAEEAPEPEAQPALPRLQPAPPPPLPAGTVLVEADDDDPELHDLDGPPSRDYRRVAGG